MSHPGEGKNDVQVPSGTESTEVAVGSADETRTTGGERAEERLATDTLIGRYAVRSVLGAGGMGVVYRAHDPELGRDLAIKLVRARRGRPEEQLLDEARTMAKLRHGNIVPVFDVGSRGDGVYIVMPLYERGTLHDWLHATRRPWRAVLEVFLAAGRGLAAAHAAGLVHRDFKPKNVFLGDAGEPLVGDFGLAASTEASIEPGGTASVTPSTIAGTPAYMAPEQAAGAALSALADQYAFCISLWEGLTGTRPTDAETRTGGSLTLPLPQVMATAAPSWLLSAVSRGFAAMPERRWASMDALLRHLDRGRGRRRRALLGVGGVAVVGAVAAGVLWARRSAAEPCPDPIATIAPAWGDSARSELTTALLATGLPFAQGTIDRVVPLLDGYATDWRTRQQAYCKAARVDRTESAALLDARMGCLAQRLTSLGTVTGSLRSDATSTIARAVDAVERLPALADCDDREALTAFPPPASPVVRARIAALEDALATSAARQKLHLQPHQQAEDLSALVVSARDLDWPPILAHALVSRAIALDDAESNDEAPAREAVEVAAQARDDRRVASAWLLVLGALARANKFAEASAVEPAARAAIVRAGNDHDLQFTFTQRRTNRAMRSDQLEEAESSARELVASAVAPDDVAAATGALAAVLATRGHPDQAVPLLREAARLAELHYGAGHPTVEVNRVSLARNLMLIGEKDEARAILESSVARLEAAFGPNHPEVAATLHTLGNLAKSQGDLQAARTYLERAVAVLETTDDKLALGLSVGALAGVVQRHDSLEASVPLYERALAILASTVGAEHQGYLSVEFNFAVVFLNLEQCARAIPLLEHVRARSSALGLDSTVIMATATLANCKIQEGASLEAITMLEPLRTRCQAKACPPGVLGEITYGLGRAYVEFGKDRRRGLALVREAIAIAERERRPANVKTYNEWLQRLSKK